MLDKNGSGSLTDAIATASISPKAVTSPKGAPTKGPSSASMNAPAAKTASLRGLAKASSFLQRAEAAKKPVPAEFAAIKPVFEKYNSFGAKKDTQNMDGRTFAKFCKVGLPSEAHRGS